MATIDITTLADTLGTDARTTRKFLREVTPAEAHPGKGSRWAIEKRDIRSLTSKFAKFTAAQAQAKAERELKNAEGDEATADPDFDADQGAYARPDED